jgi:hypothetical protein
MPSAELSALVELAKPDAKDAALRDKALEALGRADAGRGVPALIQALDDNRANVAIYALRRSVSDMPAHSALSLLSGAPRDKVTVLKEVIRLAGEFGGDDSYEFLLSFAKDENLHPDARIALLRAFWNFLEKDEVWNHFNTAAMSGNAALARSTIRIPQERLSAHGRGLLCGQMVLLLGSENAQIRMETLERLMQMPLGSASAELFVALENLLVDIDVHIGAIAARSMLETYISTEAVRLADVFSKIERPRSLAAVIGAFRQCFFADVAVLTKCAESMALALLDQRQFPSMAVRLALLALQPDGIMQVIGRADSLGLFHPGIAESNLGNWFRAVEDYPPQELAELEQKLKSAQNTAIRRLGFGLLVEMAGRYGWTDEYRRRHKAYCADVDLWIAETAGLIEPPPKMQGESDADAAGAGDAAGVDGKQDGDPGECR